jgi:long-chain acyl-CoA synthetase
MMPEYGFWKLAAEHPDKPALIDAEGRTTSAGELLRSVNRVSHGLRALGLKKGDAVAVVLKNEPAILELFMAAAQCGFYLTPINVNLAPPEIAYILGDSGARVVVCSEKVADVVRRACEGGAIGPEARFVAGHDAAPIAGFRAYGELGAGQPERA